MWNVAYMVDVPNGKVLREVGKCDLKHKVAVWQHYALNRVFLKGENHAHNAESEKGPCARRSDPE